MQTIKSSVNKTLNISKYTSLGSFAIFTVLPIVSSTVLTYLLYWLQNDLSEFSITQWLGISIALLVLCAFAIIPPTYLAILMGFFLGWKSYPLLVFINLGAIILIYGLYKILDFTWLENHWLKTEKIQKIVRKIQKNELKVVFFTKLSPLFPFVVTNLIFAVSGAKFRNILLGGFLGMIPRTLLAVFAGMEAKQVQELIENPKQSTWEQIIVIGLVMVSTVGLYFVLKNKEE